MDITLYAIPVFVALMAAEYLYGRSTGRNTYRLNDTLSSLGQALLSQALAVCTPIFQIGFYILAFTHGPQLMAQDFWGHWYGILLAIVLYDFTDYWLHRVAHECNFFWAAHVVHHQSQYFNFSTALRQESLYPIVGCAFFLPMALLGVPPGTYALAGIVVLFYQFWVHTEHIGKLGWFDLVFTSPSNHRVHHSINPQYIDKNYGSILIIWDRLFGTYMPETEPCRYGSVVALNSWSPVRSLLFVYADIAKKIRDAKTIGERLKILYKYPGWPAISRPDAMTTEQARYDPPASAQAAAWATILFLLAGLMTLALLWYADTAGYAARFLALAAILGMLFVSGRFISGKAA